MATITPVLRTVYEGKANLFPIAVRIRSGKATRFIPTGFKIDKKHWDIDKVSKKNPDYLLINSKISEIVTEANDYINECKRHNRPIKLNNISSVVKDASFVEYLNYREQLYLKNDMYNMHQKTKRFALELKLCFGGDVLFSDLNAEAVNKLNTWLIDKANSANTRAKKFEHYSKFFNAAIKEKKTEAENFFTSFKITTTPVHKEKLNFDEFERLEKLKLKPGAVALARDLFLFSYYCKGIRFETCITMLKNAEQNNRLYFQINKSFRFLSVSLHSKLKVLIDKYRGNETPLLFPVLNEVPKGSEARKKALDKANTTINRNLQIALGMADIEKHITFHNARHTFAFHLKKKKANIHVIKDSLGHGDTKITERYLSELDDEQLDQELSVLYKN